MGTGAAPSGVRWYTLSQFLRFCFFLLLFVGIGLKERVEVTHREVVAPDDAHVGDGFAVFIQRFDSGDDVVQMLLGETAAVNGETDDIRQLRLLLG